MNYAQICERLRQTSGVPSGDKLTDQIFSPRNIELIVTGKMFVAYQWASMLAKKIDAPYADTLQAMIAHHNPVLLEILWESGLVPEPKKNTTPNGNIPETSSDDPSGNKKSDT